jgi:hypothetical protein
MENLLSIDYQLSSFFLCILSIALVIWLISLYRLVWGVENKVKEFFGEVNAAYGFEIDTLKRINAKQNQLLGTRGYQIKKRDEKIAKLEVEIKSIKKR